MIPYCFAMMARAILACYGWADLNPGHDFFIKTTAIKRDTRSLPRPAARCCGGCWNSMPYLRRS